MPAIPLSSLMSRRARWLTRISTWRSAAILTSQALIPVPARTSWFSTCRLIISPRTERSPLASMMSAFDM
jgi:hypothetical protein